MNIKIENLSFSYGSRQVLNNVSFELSGGEMLCLLGPNGVGKSTLFNCILGLLSAREGAITIDGAPLSTLGTRELARKIAFVPQSHAPTFNYSVFDMVLMGTTSHVGGISTPDAAHMQIASDTLERVGISHLRDRGYMQISGGERQLTLIARALAQQAGVIIMDEPTANLDYGNQLRVLMRIKELVREGITVIQSTHNPEHAFLFADRVIALIDGKIAADGAPSESVTEELIEALYNVKVRLSRDSDGSVSCRPILV